MQKQLSKTFEYAQQLTALWKETTNNDDLTKCIRKRKSTEVIKIRIVGCSYSVGLEMKGSLGVLVIKHKKFNTIPAINLFTIISL